MYNHYPLSTVVVILFLINKHQLTQLELTTFDVERLHITLHTHTHIHTHTHTQYFSYYYCCDCLMYLYTCSFSNRLLHPRQLQHPHLFLCPLHHKLGPLLLPWPLHIPLTPLPPEVGVAVGVGVRVVPLTVRFRLQIWVGTVLLGCPISDRLT